MAELTFKSAGVSTREIDLSGPTTIKPQGVPAGVIGTALKGRAFVPITFATYQDFVAEFGATDGEKFGPLAVYEWMKNSRAGTYVRVLGTGDGNRRTQSSDEPAEGVANGGNIGKVTNAGFVVGTEQPQEIDGFLGANAFAGGTAGVAAEASDTVIEGSGVVPLTTLTAITLEDVSGDFLAINISPTGLNVVTNANAIDANDGSGNEAELILEMGQDIMSATYGGVAQDFIDALDNQTLTINDQDGTPHHFELDSSVDVVNTTATVIGIQDIADVSLGGGSHAFSNDLGFAGDNGVPGFIGNQACQHNLMAGILLALTADAADYTGILPTEPTFGVVGNVSCSATLTATQAAEYVTEDAQEVSGALLTDITHGTPAAFQEHRIVFRNNLAAGDNEFNTGVDVATMTQLLANITALVNDPVIVAGTVDISAQVTTQNNNPSMLLTQGTLGIFGDTTIVLGGSATQLTIDPAFTGGVDAVTDIVPALGRTYFLGALMSEQLDSDLFANSGISLGGIGIGIGAAGGELGQAAPLLRAVLLAPSGVLLSLSSSYYADGQVFPAVGNNTPSVSAVGQFGTVVNNDDGGYIWGTVNKANTGSQFVMLLNGHVNTPDHPNILTASFDPQAPEHYPKIFNMDPNCTEKAGHCLYASWDVYNNHAVVTGSGVIAAEFGAGASATADNLANLEECAFLVTGSLGHNSGSIETPNCENFEDRYRTAYAPWVISQKFGGKPKNLFKVHSLDDGTAGSDGFKISVSSVAASTNETTDFGTFDLFVRSMEDDDDNVVALEKFYKLDLDPTSDRYAARVIGDQYTYYDFDKPDGAQKLVIEGIHPNRSKHIRIEMDGEVDRNTIDDTALPCGFRGHDHLITSGTITGNPGQGSGHIADSLLASTPMDPTRTDNSLSLFTTDPLRELTQIPVPMRGDVTTGQSPRKKVSSNLHWGVQFQVNDDPDEPNKSRVFDKTIYAFTKYFPSFNESYLPLSVGDNAGTPDDSISNPAEGTSLDTVLDSDRFNRNLFTLENIEIRGKDENAGQLDNKEWEDALYRRDGIVLGATSALHTPRLLGGAHFQEDFSSLGARKFRKFSYFLQGGFDGLNILDKNKHKMTDLACRREMVNSNDQGGVDGPTVASYRKALDVMAEKADVDIKLLAIPGLRDASVSEYAIDTVEDRFDAMLIMDVIEVDDNNELVESKSTQKISVTNTTENLLGRNLDTSFAAAYFPDCVVPDPATRTNVLCPPSVAVLGAFALNDSVAHPWFAPAGFTRGALKRVVESQVKLNRANLDTLYSADINPLSAFPHTPGVVVWGQKTLQAANSALDRVNVRRLLIEIRRQVKRVGNTLLFEPNRAETLARFSAQVNPILQRIQAQQGLDKFKVVIDTTTTTQADVENNTVRGKIFLQPTRTIEFISLDFVVTNAGMEV